MNIIARQDLPVINGRTISLRPISDGDTELIVRWRNDPKVMQYFIFREPFTAALHEGWIRAKVDTGKVIQYIVVDRQSGQSLGSVYLRDIDPETETAEYGIFIGEDSAKGKGIGTESLLLLLALGFNLLGLKKITMRVIDDNIASIRVSEKLGFAPEECKSENLVLDGEEKRVVFRQIDVERWRELNG